MRSKLGAADTEFGFQILDLLLQRTESYPVCIEVGRVRLFEDECGQLRAGFYESIKELLILRRGVATQRGNRVGYSVERASLLTAQGRKGQFESLRIIRGDLAVEQKREIGLLFGEGHVSQFLPFGAGAEIEREIVLGNVVGM